MVNSFSAYITIDSFENLEVSEEKCEVIFEYFSNEGAETQLLNAKSYQEILMESFLLKKKPVMSHLVSRQKNQPSHVTNISKIMFWITVRKYILFMKLHQLFYLLLLIKKDSWLRFSKYQCFAVLEQFILWTCR